MVDEATRKQIHDVVRKYNATAPWCEVRHAPLRLQNAAGEQRPIEGLLDRRVVGFCGLGNPAGFRRTLEACGYNVVGFEEFPDHHNYTRADLERLSAVVLETKADALVCTHKDLVKIQADHLRGIPLWAVVIGLEFLSGEGALVEKLAALPMSEC